MKSLVFVKRILVISFVLLLLLSACNNSQNDLKKDDLPKSGILHSNITGKLNMAVSYSLYLPKGYDANRSYPVIIYFDSHAKGYTGIERMMSYADDYGYILVGSNNSKNGLEEKDYTYIVSSLFNDIFNRFLIDNNRIYLSGFSGGARVASMVALQRGGIAGVIGFSASPGSNINNFIMRNLWFYGFCGNYDMNYNEMLQVEGLLSHSKVRHFLNIFEGKHELPPSESLYDLFVWLEADAMLSNSKLKDTERINHFISVYEDTALAKIKQGKYYEAISDYDKIIGCFENLIDVYKYKQAKLELLAKNDVKKYISQIEEIKTKETELQKFYQSAFFNKSLDWWQSEMNNYDKQTDNTKDNMELAMLKRVKGYLSLMAYSYSNNALKSYMLDEADHFIGLYQIVDPTNSDHYYLRALLYATQNNYTESLKAIEQAISIGFTDYERLVSDTLIGRYRAMDEFARITKPIKGQSN